MTPKIQLHNGKMFDLLDPDMATTDLPTIAHHLSYINRYTGARHLPCSVLTHSILVCLLAPPAYKREALMHDSPEFALGDVSSPLKALLPEYRRIEHEHAQRLQRKYDLRDWDSIPEVKSADNKAYEIECEMDQGIPPRAVVGISLYDLFDLSPAQTQNLFLLLCAVLDIAD